MAETNANDASLLLRVQRLRDAARLPVRAHADDLGFDLFAAQGTTLPAGGLGRIPTGIACAPPPGYGALIKDRSSWGARGLHTLAGVIDPGYRGEIWVVVANLTAGALTVAQGTRFAQLVLVASAPASITEVADLEATTRGLQGFGSSGQQ